MLRLCVVSDLCRVNFCNVFKLRPPKLPVFFSIELVHEHYRPRSRVGLVLHYLEDWPIIKKSKAHHPIYPHPLESDNFSRVHLCIRTYTLCKPSSISLLHAHFVSVHLFNHNHCRWHFSSPRLLLTMFSYSNKLLALTGENQYLLFQSIIRNHCR